jgi:hypothetical protein
MGVQKLRKRNTVKEDVSLYVASMSNLAWLENSLFKRFISIPKLLWTVFIPLLLNTELKLITYKEQLPVKEQNLTTLSLNSPVVFLEAYSYTEEISVSSIEEESYLKTAVLWYLTILSMFFQFTFSLLRNEKAVLLTEKEDVELGYFDYRVSYDSSREKETVELTADSTSKFKHEQQDSIIIR